MKLFLRIIFKIFLILTILIGYATTEEIKETDPAALLDQGIAFAKKGQYDRAITYFSKALDKNPGFAVAYHNRGSIYVIKGQYDKAISDFNKALEINPKNAEAYYMRGNAYADKKQYELAITDYNKVIEIDPMDFPAHFNRGIAYGSKKQYDKAISDFNKALELNPRYADAYNYRGLTYAYKGQYEKAGSDWKRACELGSCKKYQFAKIIATTKKFIEQAASIQQNYWSPNADEKKRLLENSVDDLSWEQALRLLHLICLEMLSDGPCKEQLAGDSEYKEAPSGDNRELIVRLIRRLTSEGSPYKPRNVNVWQRKNTGSNKRNPDLQGEFRNVSLTHLGSLEVIRLDDNLQPAEVAFISLDKLREVVVDHPAFFRSGKLTFNDGRPDEIVLFPLLYGISRFSKNAYDKDGSFTRFICSIELKEDQFGFAIAVGHQDFTIISGDRRVLFGLGSIVKLSIINSK
jgi:Flp pilus assembly protein TadD